MPNIIDTKDLNKRLEELEDELETLQEAVSEAKEQAGFFFCPMCSHEWKSSKTTDACPLCGQVVREDDDDI